MYDLSGTIFVKEADQWVKLTVDEVLFLEADDNRTHIQTTDRRITLPKLLKDILAATPLAPLIRVHRSYAVNLEKVTAVAEGALHIGSYHVPVGRSYRKQVMDHLCLL